MPAPVRPSLGIQKHCFFNVFRCFFAKIIPATFSVLKDAPATFSVFGFFSPKFFKLLIPLPWIYFINPFTRGARD